MKTRRELRRLEPTTLHVWYGYLFELIQNTNFIYIYSRKTNKLTLAMYSY